MEDDDDRRSLQVVNSLYCHEEPLLVSSTPTPPPPAAADDDDTTTSRSSSCSSTSVLPPPHQPPEIVVGGDHHQEQQQRQLLAAEEEEAAVRYMVARQGCYAPSRGCYLHHLLSSAGGHGGVAAARSRGVHYIIYVINKLGLAASTAFNAVNYLDRFLSINCHLRWDESWMVELVSVACLSVACKLDEVNIPSLHHLQMEEVLGHSFRSATVRDMELTLLKALQWRLACVTPFSFLHYLIIPPPSSASAARCTRLLLRSLAEPSLLLRFDPSVIAASAIRCCVGLHHHHQQDYSSSSDAISRLLLLIRPADCPTKDDDDECFKMMQALLHEESCCCLDHYPYISESEQQQLQYSSGSPVPGQQTHGGTTIAAVNRSASVVSRRLFAGSTNSTYTRATKQP
ncbi:hypothetical protein GQ55_8G262200 [Panicum hallii var. hallii]|uniref:Cyclin-like domain-containing protein n=1 Tax=Panicum hallii var. hallii TaxID=1504633 RepID=A0A2T7CRF6_9POAL|nr:hypothetical protein GQ55_8G262200 [Panicum hallii var. hallii]